MSALYSLNFCQTADLFLYSNSSIDLIFQSDSYINPDNPTEIPTPVLWPMGDYTFRVFNANTEVLSVSNNPATGLVVVGNQLKISRSRIQNNIEAGGYRYQLRQTLSDLKDQIVLEGVFYLKKAL